MVGDLGIVRNRTATKNMREFSSCVKLLYVLPTTIHIQKYQPDQSHIYYFGVD